MTGSAILVLAAAVVVVHGILLRRLSSIVQPLRLRVVDEAVRLSSDARLPKDVRDGLKYVPDLLFSYRAAWLIVVMFPMLSVKDRYLSLTRPNRRAPDRRKVPSELRGQVSWVVHRATFCILANSPLACFLALVGAPIMILCAGPFDSIARRAIKASGSKLSEGDKIQHA